MFSISKILESNNSTAAVNSCDEESNIGDDATTECSSSTPNQGQLESEDDENDTSSQCRMNMNRSVGKRSTSGRETRTRFNRDQINILNQKLGLNPYPKDSEIARIAEEMGLKDRVVSVWFQNHRHTIKKKRTGTVSSSNDSSPASAMNQPNLEMRTAHAKDSLPPPPAMPPKSEPAMVMPQWASLLSIANNLNINPNILGSIMSPTPPASPAQPTSLPFNMNLLLASMNQQQQSTLFYMLLSRMSMNALQQQPLPQQQQPQQEKIESSPAKPQSDNPPPHNVSRTKKRSRSRMNKQSYNILRLIFAEYRLPSQKECEQLGELLEMNKKVVQTWFQNNRAKEKKHSGVVAGKPAILASINSGVDDLTSFEFRTDSCITCGIQYDQHEESDQRRAHLFSAEHLHRLEEYLEDLLGNGGQSNGAESSSGGGDGGLMVDGGPQEEYVLNQSDYID